MKSTDPRMLDRRAILDLPDKPEGTGSIDIRISPTLLASVMDRPFRFLDDPFDRATVIIGVYRYGEWNELVARSIRIA